MFQNIAIILYFLLWPCLSFKYERILVYGEIDMKDQRYLRWCTSEPNILQHIMTCVLVLAPWSPLALHLHRERKEGVRFHITSLSYLQAKTLEESFLSGWWTRMIKLCFSRLNRLNLVVQIAKCKLIQLFKITDIDSNLSIWQTGHSQD